MPVDWTGGANYRRSYGCRKKCRNWPGSTRFALTEGLSWCRGPVFSLLCQRKRAMKGVGGGGGWRQRTLCILSWTFAWRSIGNRFCIFQEEDIFKRERLTVQVSESQPGSSHSLRRRNSISKVLEVWVLSTQNMYICPQLLLWFQV